jgi:hypothetical protein
MKRHLYISTLLVIFCLLVTPALGQDESIPESKTKLEKFLSKKGTLIVKDFYDLGKVDMMEFEAVVLYTPGKER